MEKRSTALWRAAVPLNEGWRKLALAEKGKKYEELPGVENSIRDPANFPENSGLLGRALFAFNVVGRAHVEKSASATELKEDLLRRISAGEFELLGYRIEPTRSRSPVVIRDVDFRKYPPDWRDDSLEFRDEIYLDLRVAPAAARATGNTRGRPGSADVILGAIDELCTRPNSDFCKISRPQACEQVRQLLRSKDIKTDQLGNGLSDQNIAKIILRKCPKRRIPNKPNSQ